MTPAIFSERVCKSGNTLGNMAVLRLSALGKARDFLVGLVHRDFEAHGLLVIATNLPQDLTYEEREVKIRYGNGNYKGVTTPDYHRFSTLGDFESRVLESMKESRLDGGKYRHDLALNGGTRVPLYQLHAGNCHDVSMELHGKNNGYPEDNFFNVPLMAIPQL